MDIRVIIKIDDLLKLRSAGNSEQISKKLNISIRTVYNYINYMRVELDAPILYNSQTKSYYYTRLCELNFRG